MGVYINKNRNANRVDGAAGPASSIAYNNTESGLDAENVQGAIDEVQGEVTELNSKIISIEITISQVGGNAVNIPDGYDTILSVMYKNTDNKLWYLELDKNKVVPMVDTLNNIVSLYCSEIPYYPRYKIALIRL